jgi:hypothetical protein
MRNFNMIDSDFSASGTSNLSIFFTLVTKGGGRLFAHRRRRRSGRFGEFTHGNFSG